MSAATIECDVCGETLEWAPGNALQHIGGTVGYLHVLVSAPLEEDAA